MIHVAEGVIVLVAFKVALKFALIKLSVLVFVVLVHEVSQSADIIAGNVALL